MAIHLNHDKQLGFFLVILQRFVPRINKMPALYWFILIKIETINGLWGS